MSRIDELKKQHPNYALSIIDIYKMISPNQSSKYIEMLIKLDKNREFNEPDVYRRQIIECMVGWGIDYNYLETFDLETLNMFFINVNNLVGDTGKIRSFTKFASLNERKLIENNDITSYSSWDEIEQAISLAEIKLIDKETAKQIKKIYEDDEWLSLRPLSLEASMKYGANTKWCTTTQSGQYYARYSARGILIYNINKKTGYKVACFKNLDQAFDNEFSWWDVTDKKIEVLDSEAPSTVLEAIRNEIKNRSVPNQLLMTKAESEKLELYKDGRSYNSGPDIGVGYISGGLSGTTSTNTLVFNPSTFTTTGTLTTSSNTGLTYYTGNIGIGNTNPTTQMQVNGDLEVRDGNIRMIDFNGAETMRITSNGETIVTAPDGRRYINGIMQQPEQPTQEYRHFDEGPTEDQRRLMAELRFRDSDRQSLTNEQIERQLFPNADRIAADAQQRLDDEMGAQLAEANERVAEKHLSLLENIEMGTLDDNIIRRMQMMAGIKNTKQQIQQLETEIEQLRAKDNQEAQPENVHLSLWNKIKNTGQKLSRTFTSRSRKQIGALPMSISARLEAVKQSQEL